MVGQGPVLFSRGLMSNLKALRKLAAGSNLKLNETHCNVSGYFCQNYHVMASNCVQNYLRTSEKFTRHSPGSSGFLLSSNHERISCISDCNVLRNGLYSNAYRYRNSHNALLNPWKDTLSSPHRQFSLSPKVILEASPKPLQPYLRLIRFDKPIGSYLLFWPCTWSIGLAAQAGHLPNLYILGLFGLGSFLMRGAGCIINDMWDKEIDKRVERTKARPLASGELSQFQALCILGVNLSLSLGILLQLNMYSVVLGASSMILVILYPLAKRFTYWPQFVLGLTFNYGAMLGWTAVRGAVDWPILPLYVSCLLWTLIYDTIYAHQDKYDDMLVGVKSTALKLGDKTKPWLLGFSSAMLSGLTVAGYLCDQTWPYYLAVTATGAHLWWQLSTVNLDNPDDCFAKFKSNSWLGVVLFTGIVAGTLLKEDKKDQDESNAIDLRLEENNDQPCDV